jgi:hypothetical protein
MDEATDARRYCCSEHMCRACHITAFKTCRIGRVHDACDMQDGIGPFAQFDEDGGIIQAPMYPSYPGFLGLVAPRQRAHMPTSGKQSVKRYPPDKARRARQRNCLHRRTS